LRLPLASWKLSKSKYSMSSEDALQFLADEGQKCDAIIESKEAD
jgi:hypothetical protein